MSLYIQALRLSREILDNDEYYASLPALQGLWAAGKLTLKKPVTFFVGENGTGKSTLLEAIAVNCGFNPEGGTVNFHFSTSETHSGLHEFLRVGRSAQRPKDGFFLRAESFYNVASEVDRLETVRPLRQYYGGKSLHAQSHGESFMALVLHRFGGNGLYILDEPEAALSPSRQMALLAAVHALVKNNSQFIISTHSPLLMAYPGADIYELNEDGMQLTPYRETGHYTLTKQFLDAPEHTLKYLLEE